MSRLLGGQGQMFHNSLSHPLRQNFMSVKNSSDLYYSFLIQNGTDAYKVTKKEKA